MNGTISALIMHLAIIPIAFVLSMSCEKYRSNKNAL
jgi:hypothetical protein